MGDGFVRPLTAEQTRIPPAMLADIFGPPRAPMRGNLPLLEALDREQCLEFRGVLYRVPPVPTLAGWALQAALEEFQVLTQDVEGMDGIQRLRRVKDGFEQLVRIMIPLAEPVVPPTRPSLVVRLLAWLRLRPLPAAPSHPFLDASVREVAELVHFFSVRTRTSSVRNRSTPHRRPARSM